MPRRKECGDPVSDVRKVRDAISKRFGHDVVAYGRYLMRIQEEEKRKGVRYISRPLVNLPRRSKPRKPRSKHPAA